MNATTTFAELAQHVAIDRSQSWLSVRDVRTGPGNKREKNTKPISGVKE